ncbi:DEAD/DEAH box helicase [Enterococcus sp. LJL98]
MEELIGRQVVMSSQKMKTYASPDFLVRPALLLAENIDCQRCSSVLEKESHCLPNGAYFCSVCLHYGRLTSADFLVSKHETKNGRLPREVCFSWNGVLTSLQREIAERLLHHFEQEKDCLLWAVTGSGKTEMIFPLIHHVLKNGGRVCVTSPRIDVCRELHPRIQAAFSSEPVLLLYGESEEKYRYCPLLVCTTHQLLHFYQAFDLIIVDEIDAFPYEGNPMLRHALKQARRLNGRQVYLTATPSNQLLKELGSSFMIEKSPLRFHQRPLIVPECLWYGSWEKCAKSKHLLRKLVKYLNALLIDNDVLVFCPSILYMERLYHQLIHYFPEKVMASVHSEDVNRKVKIENMRAKQYRILLTSTILERGVTFEKVSVIVMGANHPVFTKSALVQIAGRVDRKGPYSKGRVLFFYSQMTKAMKQACQEVQTMNHLAVRWLEK